MKLPPLRSATTATVHTCQLLGGDGRLYVSVVIKQAFQVTLAGVVTRVDGAEVTLADELWEPDKPEASSLKLASDLCLFKPATDILVLGAAMAPGKRASTQLDVLVRVAQLTRTLRVLGDRVWYKGLTSLVPTEPQPFESMPLKWELAYGGRDDSAGPLLEEPRNPVGRGVCVDAKKLVHQPLPNFEDPLQLIKNETSKPAPAGLGPIMRHWAPRKAFAGSYDEAWQRERVPLAPLDFDDRFNQLAPAELIYPGYLQGGEQVDLWNLCEQGALRFLLPKLSFFVGSVSPQGELVEHRPVLDTLSLRPNELAFDLVWRSRVPMPARVHQIAAVQVHERQVLT